MSYKKKDMSLSLPHPLNSTNQYRAMTRGVCNIILLSAYQIHYISFKNSIIAVGTYRECLLTGTLEVELADPTITPSVDMKL
jgi:hypothetical protein